MDSSSCLLLNELMKARIRLTLSLILATIVAGASSALGQDIRADAITAEGVYVRAELAAFGGPKSWVQPVHAYFLRQHANWKLVGFERVPDGNAPQSAPQILERSPAANVR